MTDTMSVAEAPASTTGRLWDYRVATVHARHNDVLERELQTLGRESWELVFMHMPMANEYQMILKRPAA